MVVVEICAIVPFVYVLVCAALKVYFLYKSIGSGSVPIWMPFLFAFYHLYIMIKKPLSSSETLPSSSKSV